MNFLKKVLRIKNFFDSLIGFNIELAVRKKSYGFDVYAVKDHGSKIFGKQVDDIISFILLGLASILFAFIVLTIVTFKMPISIEPFVILSVLLFIAFYFVFFVGGGVSVKLKKAERINISPFWDLSLFKREYKVLIDFQKGRFIEFIGFILSGMILISIMITMIFIPEFFKIITEDYYAYLLAGLVITPMAASEFIASQLKSEYKKQKTEEML